MNGNTTAFHPQIEKLEAQPHESEGIRLLRKKIFYTCRSDNFTWVKILAFCTDHLKWHISESAVTPFGAMFLLPSISPRVNQSRTAGFPYNRLDRLQGPNIFKICPCGRGAHMVTGVIEIAIAGIELERIYRLVSI